MFYTKVRIKGGVKRNREEESAGVQIKKKSRGEKMRREECGRKIRSGEGGGKMRSEEWGRENEKRGEWKEN